MKLSLRVLAVFLVICSSVFIVACDEWTKDDSSSDLSPEEPKLTLEEKMAGTYSLFSYKVEIKEEGSVGDTINYTPDASGQLRLKVGSSYYISVVVNNSTVLLKQGDSWSIDGQDIILDKTYLYLFDSRNGILTLIYRTSKYDHLLSFAKDGSLAATVL